MKVISNAYSLAKNFDIAYADGKITKTEVKAIQNALDTQKRVGSDYFQPEIERYAAVSALQARGAADLLAGLATLHPAGKPSLECKKNECRAAIDRYMRGLFEMYLASTLSTGFDLGPAPEFPD
jgi:hypothetical protein